MFPIPDSCITLRVIKNEVNIGRRMFLNEQLNFCNDNTVQILNMAKRTYQVVVKKLNPNLLVNACDFKLLEQKCLEYEKSHQTFQQAATDVILKQISEEQTGTE